MRQIILVFLLTFSMPLLADKPSDIRINVIGTFDANHVLSGTFTASGFVNELGSLLDTPLFSGQAIHISRLLTTSHGEYITIEINANHIAGLNVTPPDWCPPPPTPEGTLLFFQTGNWRVVSGTGPFSLLSGTGSRASWVLLDAGSFTPIAATECLIGKVKNVP